VRLHLADRPGSLAGLLAVLAAAEANVLEVQHVRTAPDTPVDRVEVVLRLETQGPQHRRELLAALAGAGYTVLPT
jgi:threonine dehydratase